MLVATGLMYTVFLGLYKLGVSCVSLDTQTRQGQLAEATRVVEHGYRYTAVYDIVTFTNDDNHYHVPWLLFRKLRTTIGGTYEYTVVTSFGGRQFLRRAPLLVIPPLHPVPWEPTQRGFRHKKTFIAVCSVVCVLVIGSAVVTFGPFSSGSGNSGSSDDNSVSPAASAVIASDIVAVQTQDADTIFPPPGTDDGNWGNAWGLVVAADTVVVPESTIASGGKVFLMNASGHIAAARVLASDVAQDLAVLRAAGIAPSPAVSFATAPVRTGDAMSIAYWGWDSVSGTRTSEPQTWNATVAEPATRAPASSGSRTPGVGGVFSATVTSPRFALGIGLPGLSSWVMLNADDAIAGLVVSSTSNATASTLASAYTVYAVPAATIEKIAAKAK